MIKKYKVVIADAAKLDVKEIILNYKLIQKELAKRFSADLQIALFSIEKLPSAYAKRYGDVRFANLDIFPYLVEFFIKDNNEIIVIAVLYNGRDPNFLKSRSQLKY